MASFPTKPRLIKHHSYRSWTSFWRDDDDKLRTKRFGRERQVSKQVALARYANWIAEWKRSLYVRNPNVQSETLTVRGLAQAYVDYAQGYFVKNGKPTSHVYDVLAAMQALSDMYGDKAAELLTPAELAKLRDAMIFGHRQDPKTDEMREYRRSLKTVNGRLHTIQQAYQWAVEKGWIPAPVWQGLMAVSRLKRGRSQAKDPKRVTAVAQHWVERTIKCCPPTLQAMIHVQWLTGMRPGEVCIIRPIDLDMSGRCWIYVPQSHKTQHLEKCRRVAIGPRAQAILKRFLGRDTTTYLFTPAEAEQQRLATRHEGRKTPLKYGNRPGTNRKDTRQLRPCYTTESFRKAIHHACHKAEIPLWNPNQLRHAWATRIEKNEGVEMTSAGLGHSTVDTTELYLERDLERAKELAVKYG